MREAPLPIGIVVKAYLLSYCFLRDQQDALEALRKAARRLGPAVARQCKRMASQPKKRTITNLERNNLYLALVIDATDEIAARERRAGSSMILTPADYIRQFLLHAVHISREHSLPLAVAVTRIIHSYKGDVTKRLYEEILFGSGRGDYGYREIKQKQTASLDLSFKGLLRKKRCANNEDRFEAMVSAGLHVDLAHRTLEMLTVWGADYAVPAGFLASRMKLEAMRDSDNPDETYLADRRRMENLSHPAHFGNLVAGVDGLLSARKSYSIPLFYLPDGPHPDLTGDVRAEEKPPMPDESALLEIANVPAEQGTLRESWSGGEVTVYVDGLALQSIISGRRYALRNRHAGFVAAVEIWGECGGADVVLDAITFNLIEDGPAGLIAGMLLADGSEVKIQAIVRGTDDAPVLTLRIAYGVALDDADPNAADRDTRFALVIPFTPKGPVKDVKPKSRDPSAPRS